MKRVVLNLLASVLSPARAEPARIIYITDLEGSRAKLERIYAESGAFSRATPAAPWRLRDGFTLVYGGDVPDRYYGAQFLIDEFNRHHEEYPDRVVLIAGNRDLKALRFRVELTDEALTQPPHWTHFSPPDAYAAESAAPPDRLRRLHYILNHTMGSAAAFELRRRELAAARREATDAAVMRSLLADVAPGGPFLKLLSRMKLAWRAGCTLFVHGGLTRENAGRVPGRLDRVDDLDAWVDALNGWWDQEVRRFEGPTPWSGLGPRPGESFHEYSMPAAGLKTKPESVITGRWADEHSNPRLPPDEVVAWLLAHGVRRLVVGHTPVGDRAVTVRTADGRFEMIWADNSYTPDETNPTWVTLGGPNFAISRTFGRLRVDDEWRAVESVTEVDHPSPVGGRTHEDFLVVGWTTASVPSANRRLIATRTESYKVINIVADATQLHWDDCAGRLAPATVDPGGGLR